MLLLSALQPALTSSRQPEVSYDDVTTVSTAATATEDYAGATYGTAMTSWDAEMVDVSAASALNVTSSFVADSIQSASVDSTSTSSMVESSFAIATTANPAHSAMFVVHFCIVGVLMVLVAILGAINLWLSRRQQRRVSWSAAGDGGAPSSCKRPKIRGGGGSGAASSVARKTTLKMKAKTASFL